MSTIVGAQIIKHGRAPSTYGIAVRLLHGETIHIACRSRDGAREALEALKHHLPVETRSYRTQRNFAAQDNAEAAPLRPQCGILSA